MMVLGEGRGDGLNSEHFSPATVSCTVTEILNTAIPQIENFKLVFLNFINAEEDKKHADQ